MSFTRLDYDKCAYKKTLEESCSPLDYQLYMGKYENSKQCPVGDHTNNLEFGIKTDVQKDPEIIEMPGKTIEVKDI